MHSFVRVTKIETWTRVEYRILGPLEVAVELIQFRDPLDGNTPGTLGWKGTWP